MELSRRRYLLTAGSALAFAGCSTDSAPETGGRSGVSLSMAGRGSVAVDYYVGAEGEYDNIGTVYEQASPGDVIGLGPGDYSLQSVLWTIDAGPFGPYATLGKAGLTVVGSGKDETTLSFENDEDMFVFPAWQCAELTVDAAGAVVGPRGDTFRTCRIGDPIMDPPGYASGSAEVRPGMTVTSSGLAPTPSAARTYHGLAFDRVVDAVDDLGFDNTGSEPIDDRFEAAYESGTLIEFPPGEYLVTRQHVGDEVSRFGLRGRGPERRDVRIVAASGEAVKWLKAADAGPHLIENLCFDERSDDTTQLSLWLTTGDGSVMRNVEWLGRTPNDDGFNYTLTAETNERDGVFVIDGIYAGLDEPAVPVTYPEGVTFLRCGPTHFGEIVLRNPIIHERNSAATRSTAPEGVMTIEGGEFVNNQNANIRFSAGNHPSKVSSATGTYVKVDGSRNSADAVRLDSGSKEFGGSVLRGLDIEWTKQEGRGVIALPEYTNHGRAEFYDCVVHNDGEETFTVNAAPTSTTDSELLFENCSFTGSGRGFLVRGRPGSEIRDSCLAMPEASIRGVRTSGTARSGCRRPVTPNGVVPRITVQKRGETGITFSAADTRAPGSGSTQYRWAFDGATATGQTVTHNFGTAGTYRVDLTVETDDGRGATENVEIIVDYPSLV
jgi:hypothetical protein